MPRSSPSRPSFATMAIPSVHVFLSSVRSLAALIISVCLRQESRHQRACNETTHTHTWIRAPRKTPSIQRVLVEWRFHTKVVPARPCAGIHRQRRPAVHHEFSQDPPGGELWGFRKTPCTNTRFISCPVLRLRLYTVQYRSSSVSNPTDSKRCRADSIEKNRAMVPSPRTKTGSSLMASSSPTTLVSVLSLEAPPAQLRDADGSNRSMGMS